jgi:hypothetical protein
MDYAQTLADHGVRASVGNAFDTQSRMWLPVPLGSV